MGGPGLFPGVNVGEGVAVFEQGARHVAKDIAGQGVANPSAGLLAAAMMLRHLNLPGFSDRYGSAGGQASRCCPANHAAGRVGVQQSCCRSVRRIAYSCLPVSAWEWEYPIELQN